MRIIEYEYGRMPQDSIPSSVLALGLFDGVHIGHRKLIAETVAAAKKRGLVPGIFTFPTEAALPKSKDAPIIYSTAEKLEIFEGLGIELVILADFSSLCRLSKEDFADRVLWGELKCRMACMGYNFRFGRNAEGDADFLAKRFSTLGGECLILNEQKYDGHPLSSTDVRRLLAEADAEGACKLLGAPYFIRGIVEKGLGLGGKFGFPTINTTVPDTSPLARGVYRTAVKLSGKLYNGVTNVGLCPTFGERQLHAETMILDFSEDVYGKEVTLYFLGLIREERRFSSPEELKAQIDRDAAEAKKKNGEIKWQEIGLSSP